MSNILLGIDIGTYTSKGVLVEADGIIAKTALVEHEMSIPQPGWAEQDADAIWWGDLIKLCRLMLNGDPYKGSDVGAMAVSAIGPCMLPLDGRGHPLRPGILYGVDTRASSQIENLNRRYGENVIYDFSGMALTSQAVGPKILWMRENEPELWKKVAHITTASSYLIYRLTGEKVIDRHTASHFMPLMELGNLEWSERFADELVDIEKLPRLGWSDEVAGRVTRTGAEETSLPVGTPVAVGAVDALSEAISVGVFQTGDLMVMYGSTAFFILVEDAPRPDPRVWTVAGAFQGQYNLAAGMATTGSLTRWFRDELARDLPEETAYATLFAEAEQIPAGSGGLLLLPYFSGERTPLNDSQARGVFAGLTLAHTRAHLFRAILESVAYGIRHNIETFRSISADVRRVVAVGGGTKSRTWLQIVSDVAGVVQEVPLLTIGASYGDAFLAGLSAGILQRKDLASWVKPGTIIKPDPKKEGLYSSFYADYRLLYERTSDIVHRLGKSG
jgi:xylulokinase